MNGNDDSSDMQNSEINPGNEDPSVIDKYVLVKKSVCPACNAPKVKPSKNFYVYCDFCAAFMDTDYKFAGHATEAPNPSSEYMVFMQTMGQRTMQATKARDKNAYADVYREYFKLSIAHYPEYYPPRIHEEKFRQAYIDYSTQAMVENEFYPPLKEMGDKFSEVMGKVEWKQVTVNGEQKTIIALEDLRAIYEDVKKRTKVCMDHYKNIGLEYPDKSAGPSLTSKLTSHMFVEGYLPYLLEDDQEKWLQDAGLLGEYKKVEKPPLNIRHCGWCGAVNSVVENSRRTLCESCGHFLDVSKTEFKCPGCHASVSVPYDTDSIHCPYCSTHFKTVD